MKFIFTTEADKVVLDKMFENWTEEELKAIGHVISDVSHYGYKKGLVRGAVAATVGGAIGIFVGHKVGKHIVAKRNKAEEEN